MLYVCKECFTQSDTRDCDICGKECIEARQVFTFKIELTCSQCGSVLEKHIDWKTDNLNSATPYSDRFLNKYCPRCECTTLHNVNVIEYNAKSDPSEYLQSLYSHELRRGEK